MSKKVKVNLIYAPQSGTPLAPRHTTELGELWMNNAFDGSGKYDHNIAMSFYSASEGVIYPEITNSNMSIFVVEPKCVSMRDYNVRFLSNFKYIFTWATKAFTDPLIKNKVIELNHGSCFGFNQAGYEQRKQSWASWQDRRKEIVFIANNKSSDHYSELYSFRTKCADWFYENSKEYKIKWYSQIPISKPYYCGTLDNKNEILSKVRFSVCTENCYDPVYSHGYFSEKYPEVLFNAALPLYIGCFNIDDFNFHPDSYIDLRNWVKKDKNQCDIDFPAILREIEGFTEEKYNNYLKAIDINIYERGLFNIISEERVMAKMIETCYNAQ